MPEEYYMDDGYNEPNFDDAFEGSYIVEGITYDITIQGMYGENNGKDNYYIASYSDGTFRTINYQFGTGWIEREVGQTLLALAIAEERVPLIQASMPT